MDKEERFSLMCCSSTKFSTQQFDILHRLHLFEAMNTRLAGIILLVVAVILLIWGLNAADALKSNVSELVDGTPSRETMVLYIGSAITGIAGIVLLFRKRA